MFSNALELLIRRLLRTAGGADRRLLRSRTRRRRFFVGVHLVWEHSKSTQLKAPTTFYTGVRHLFLLLRSSAARRALSKKKKREKKVGEFAN